MIECESCHEWIEDSGIIWDLIEDRMVCIPCYARFCPIPEIEACDGV